MDLGHHLSLHIALFLPKHKDAYIRMLFIDHSFAFNAVINHKFTKKLFSLGLTFTLCDWLLDFLTGRPQSVRTGNLTSSAIVMNTGIPQGCVLSPMLYTLLT